MARKNVVNPSGYHSSGRTLAEKATNFGAYVKPYGWAGSWKTAENGNVLLTANRGENEFIEIEWFKGGGGTVWYTLAGERIKCHNVSGAALIAQNEPDPNRLKRAVRSRKRSGNTDLIKSEYDFDGLTDREIKDALYKKRITWVNSMSGEPYTAMMTGRRHFKVVRNGHDYVEFTDDYGFHAVYLDRIVSVA